MNTPTATPRTDAALYPMNGVEIVWPDFARTLETELAAAQAECERLKFATEGHLLKTIQQQAELAHLRAEVERLTVACNNFSNAEIAEGDWKARAERAEAALAEWSVLNLWGGTPEIIHEFIKGQQNRIHYCQDLETELDRLRAEVERLTNQRDNLLKPMREQAIARAEKAEAALAEAIDGVIDGGSIPDTLLVVHVPRSPVGYRVGQPVKVILPSIDAAMKGTT